ERSFASMVLFTKNGGTRLVQIRALSGDFPYYGKLETAPEAAGKEFRNHRRALVDKTLLLQFGSDVGDSVKIGEVKFEIAGSLDAAHGECARRAGGVLAGLLLLALPHATGLSP